MRWHYLPTKPNPETSSVLCVVELEGDYQSFELVRYHKSTGTFCRQHDSSFTLKESNIVKWAYINEDDCVTEEMTALTAIKTAANSVYELINVLLTDGICCGNDYREIIGLNELETFCKKISDRIISLDESITDIPEENVTKNANETTYNQKNNTKPYVNTELSAINCSADSIMPEEPRDDYKPYISNSYEEESKNELLEELTEETEDKLINDTYEKHETVNPELNNEKEIKEQNVFSVQSNELFVIDFKNKKDAKHIKIHKLFFNGEECEINKEKQTVTLKDVLRTILLILNTKYKGSVVNLCKQNWFYSNGKNPALCLRAKINSENKKNYESLSNLSKDLKDCYVYKTRDNISSLKLIEDVVFKITKKKEFYIVASHV